MGGNTLLEDAIILFGVLAFWGVIVGAITAVMVHYLHKE
jgi:hypothetical protein